MNKDILQGQWKQIVGKIKEKWGKFTEDELTKINGRRDILIGKLQEKYGMAKERAEKEVHDLEESFSRLQEENESRSSDSLKRQF
ncbi:CsbD family protein [Parachlamydia sp. AcF125]|uniref:CsbD family protein n=1 Tax=Parachlamydia sp. AcF125 TaxID=2795736 RepID=UPI0032D571F0